MHYVITRCYPHFVIEREPKKCCFFRTIFLTGSVTSAASTQLPRDVEQSPLQTSHTLSAHAQVLVRAMVFFFFCLVFYFLKHAVSNSTPDAERLPQQPPQSPLLSPRMPRQ